MSVSRMSRLNRCYITNTHSHIICIFDIGTYRYTIELVERDGSTFVGYLHFDVEDEADDRRKALQCSRGLERGRAFGS